MNDYVSSQNKRQFVLDQLAQYAGLTNKLADSTFVCCPYHAENTPSARIFHSITSRSPGYLKCYGCGERHPWDEFAPKLGLQPFKRQKPADEYSNMSLLPDSTAEELEDELFVQEEIEFSDLPEGKLWRGIKTSLLTAIGAKRCRIKHPEHGWLTTKIYLPVFINKELRGYIKARLKKHEDYPSYINAKGSWSKTHGLFPLDYAVKVAKRLKIRTIVLVEGPRDALRLLQAGIPAVCILGTQSWSANKNKLLELAGITKLILMMDGDCAGIKATELIKASASTMFDIVVLKLWEMNGSPYLAFKDESEPSKAAKASGVNLWDPGNCPDWILTKIITKYFTRS